jgi:hypothetical protein
MSGHEGGCTLKAGPVTADLQYGQLDIRSSSTPDAMWARRYYAGLSGMPSVQGTMTCPNGTFTRNFGPRASILSTSGILDPQRVSPRGALEGTASPWQGSDVTANYKWKLVPQQ